MLWCRHMYFKVYDPIVAFKDQWGKTLSFWCQRCLNPKYWLITDAPDSCKMLLLSIMCYDNLQAANNHMGVNISSQHLCEINVHSFPIGRPLIPWMHHSGIGGRLLHAEGWFESLLVGQERRTTCWKKTAGLRVFRRRHDWILCECGSWNLFSAAGDHISEEFSVAFIFHVICEWTLISLVLGSGTLVINLYSLYAGKKKTKQRNSSWLDWRM